MITRRGFSRHPRARGSVLIFAIIILSILFLVVSSFLFVARQSRAAASNGLRNVAGEMAATSGINDAKRVLRGALTGASIATPDGVYDPAAANYLATDHEPVVAAEAIVSPLRYFEVDPADGADYEDGALLFWDPEKTYNNVALDFEPDVPPFFSTSPMTTTSYPDGQPRLSHGLPHDGTAMRQVVGTTPPLDFYPATAQPRIQKLPQIGTLLRGEYYVWVADLDSKLYAVPQEWGVDTTNTIDPVDAGFADNAEWEKTIRTDVMKSIVRFGEASSSSPSSSWGYASLYDGIRSETLDVDLDIDAIDLLPAGTRFDSIRDFALKWDALSDPADLYYPSSRGALDRYFTVHKDTPDVANPLPFKFVKDAPTAVNINTAPPEVIAAALAGVPSDLNGETINTTDPDRSLKIAKRIVSKRPFLCRMDFEDFLAAHIKGRSSDLLGGPYSVTSTVALTPADPDPYYVQMIHFAIGKRVDGELTLSQYLEIPGISDTDPVYLGANTRAKQLERFEWFFAEDADAPRADALISFKEFNNLINSVNGLGSSSVDDVQTLKPDPSATPAASEDVEVIGPGVNGVLDSPYVSGDDLLISHIVLGPTSTTVCDPEDVLIPGTPAKIETGTDLVLDTVPDPLQGDVVVLDKIVVGDDLLPQSFIRNNRPSYYSYFEDTAYTYDMFWSLLSPMVDVATSGATPFDATRTIAQAELETMEHTRLYYRLKAATVPMTPRPSATIEELYSWRCNPKHSDLTQGRAGLYQLTFDDWANPYGPMQVAPDPDFADAFGTEEYSSANRYSGKNTDGDVSWSPAFAFRSRFYGIYVLGRGLTQKNDGDASPKLSGETRLEAVYDALKDEVLWQRTQLSEKRALGE